MAKRKKKNSALRAAMQALCAVLGVVLIVLAGATVYAKYLLGRINYVQGEEQMSREEASEYLATEETDPEQIGDETMETLTDDDIEWGTDPVETIEQSEHIVNILLIGQDARPGEPRSRSDVMILCTINQETKTLTMTSFLRDLYVQIPGYGNSKLTHTYVWGGMSLLNETLEQNFGVHVDGNLEVNFESFSKLIDLLGGVDLELRYDEAVVINNEVGYLGMVEGANHRAQALQYARIRKLDADADFSRTNRQRKLLTALIGQFRNADLPTLLQLLNEALPMLTTDMTESEIIGYAKEFFPLLSDLTVVSQRIPADNAYTLASAGGMSVVKADMDAARKLLRETIGE